MSRKPLLTDAALDALPMGLMTVSASGVIETVNQPAATLLGRKPDELEGQRLYDALGGSRPSAALVELIEAGLKASTIFETEAGRQVMAVIRRAGPETPAMLVVLHDLQVLDHERQRASAPNSKPAFKLMGQRLPKPDLAHQRRISPYLNQLITLGERAMAQGARVLLLGESGAGKTEIARYLHSYVAPQAAPFIHVNCGSIPDTLFESEMFGYERGAFTGALSGGKKGLIEAADGGTLFLDEVGEIPLAMQAKLLKFLESGTVQRVGGSSEKAVKVRIIAATNRDLAAMVAAGQFRRDLYYRLAVVPLNVKSLSELPELVSELIDHFVSVVNQRRGQQLTLTAACKARLMGYSFPGNIRELQNIVQQLSVMAADVADVGHLPETVLLQHMPRGEPVADDGDLKARVRAYERRVIEDAIGRLGSKRKAAEALGVDIGTIVRKTQARH